MFCCIVNINMKLPLEKIPIASEKKFHHFGTTQQIVGTLDAAHVNMLWPEVI